MRIHDGIPDFKPVSDIVHLHFILKDALFEPTCPLCMANMRHFLSVVCLDWIKNQTCFFPYKGQVFFVSS